jgi:hypothetical protein
MPVDRLGWWVATLKEPTPPSLAYKKGFETSNEISKSQHKQTTHRSSSLTITHTCVHLPYQQPMLATRAP